MKLTFLSSNVFNHLTAAARRPSAALMAESLEAKGAPRFDAAIVGADVRRMNALHQLDFAGESTAFEHIERIAAAKSLADGSASGPLATDLAMLAGSARSAIFGKCYARTTHTIYSVHHSGEMMRILHDLAVDGRVTMADGTVATWHPATYPIAPGEHADRLWGALNHLLTAKTLPENATLSAESDSAYRGQMANVTSRLMGEQFVNADGSAAMPHLNGVVDSYGPMLSEYGLHGGSVAKVEDGLVSSLEGGETEANYQAWRKLGYVVVPAQEAQARGLATLGYAIDDDKGYATIAPAKTESHDS